VTDLSDPPAATPAARRPPRQEQEPASDEVTEIAPGVIRMQLPIWMPGLGHVNMYGLIDDDGLAVVDPGLPGPASWRALKRRLRSAGFRLRDVHTVVVTHSHPDHFGGAGRIRREAGADVLTHRSFTTWSTKRNGRRAAELAEPRSEAEAAHAEETVAAAVAQVELSPDEMVPTHAESVASGEGDDDRGDVGSAAGGDGGRRPVPWGGETPWGGSRHPMPPLRRRLVVRALRMLFSPPDPSRRVVHGDPVGLAGREWTALHTPGHTQDHLCLYDAEHGLLLSGDHVLPSITPHVSGVGNGTDALDAYLTTLDLVAGLDGIRLGLPAHGHPFHDVPGRVNAIKRHHHERMDQLAEASRALGPATVQQLCREVFPRRHWGVMAESETFAHLEHLARSGAAERVREGGQLRYRIA